MTTSIQENSYQKDYPLSGKSAWWGLFAVIVVMLSVLLSPSIFRMLSSDLWNFFGITEGQWSLFTALRGLFFIIFVLGAGVAGDFWGRRRILLFVQWVFIALSFVIVFLPLGNLAFLTYIFIGIFGTMVRTLTITMVILIFSQRERLLGVMIYSAFSGLAYLLSPLISGHFLEIFSLKALFIFPALLGIIGVWLVLKKIPESHSLLKGGHRDVVALALLAFSICVLIFSVILARSIGWGNPIILAGFAFGAVLFFGVNWLENRSRAKSWVFTLHVEKQLLIAILAGVILNTSLFAIVMQIYNFLRKIQGYTLLDSVLAFLPLLAGAFFLGTLTKRILTRLSMRDALALSLLVVTLPALGLYFLDTDMPYWVIALHLFVLGFGYILGNSPYLVLLSSSVPLDLVATVQAIGSSTSRLGAALAYSFMLTLMEGFGAKAYIDLLGQTGLTPEEAAKKMETLLEVSERIFAAMPETTQKEILYELDYFFKKAYIMGASWAMLTLAGICVISAVLVYVGLKVKKKEIKK